MLLIASIQRVQMELKLSMLQQSSTVMIFGYLPIYMKILMTLHPHFSHLQEHW